MVSCNRGLSNPEEYVVHVTTRSNQKEFWESSWKRYVVGDGVLSAPVKYTGVSKLTCGWKSLNCSIICESCARQSGYLW